MPVDARVALIILAVRDVSRATRFYREAFGWTQTVDVPVYAEFMLPDNLRLGLYERASFGANTGVTPIEAVEGGLTSTELYLYADDFSLLVEQLENAGARELSSAQERSWGEEVAYFADPDGNVLALARPIQGDRGQLGG
jgi:catechol 2,3-dioxygenase-like lactoylglutathione lyase family enzyme